MEEVDEPDIERIDTARTLRTAFVLGALCLLLSLCGFFVHRTLIHRERFSHAPILSDDFLRIDIAGETGGFLCARNSTSEPFSCAHPNTWQRKVPLLGPGDRPAPPFVFCESTLLLDGKRVIWPATCHIQTEKGCVPAYQCSVFSPFGENRASYEIYYAVGGGFLAIAVFIFIDVLSNVLSACFCGINRCISGPIEMCGLICNK